MGILKIQEVFILAGACVTVNNSPISWVISPDLAGACAAVNAFNDRLREIACAGGRDGELP